MNTPDPLTALLNAVPPQYHAWLILGGVSIPCLTRALHALANGRGLIGAASAVLFGTNTPAASSKGESVKVNVIPILAFCGIAILSLSLLVGCKATLQPGGAYAPLDTNGVAQVAPDLGFFEVDSAFDLADTTLRDVTNFERDNRAMLWQLSHSIKHALDAIRPDIETAELEYAKARVGYKASPVPANLSTLQTILAKAQQLAAAAQAALPSSTAPAAPPTPATPNQ